MGKIMTSFKNMMGFEEEELYDDYEVEEQQEEETTEPKENYSILTHGNVMPCWWMSHPSYDWN